MRSVSDPVCRYPLCGKRFFNVYNLKRHYNSQHLHRKFPCTICGKHLSSRQTLREHQATHLGIMLYTCPYAGCEAEFRQASQLSNHKKLHLAQESGASLAVSVVEDSSGIPFMVLPPLPSPDGVYQASL